MLNTALRTSQQRVLGTAILQWDTFSLDVCHVLQFYREALAEPISHNNSFIILHHPWSSLIILVYFGIIWNLDIFLETFGYFWDILEICWRSIIRVSSVIISYIQQISCKSSFFLFTNYKSDISHFATFFSCYSPVVPPCCNTPVVFPCCVSPFLGSKSSGQPSRLSKKEQTDGNKNETKNEIRSWNKMK